MPSLMISVSGVRGVVGNGLSPDIVVRYSAAFGTYCRGGTVVVGRDTRISGPMIEQAVYSGLMATGCTVIPLGVSATPTVQCAVTGLGADGGIAITASHNPSEWNALKFFDRSGKYLGENEGKHLSKTVADVTFHYVTPEKLGKISRPATYITEHIKAIVGEETVKTELIRKKMFTVAVDCVNGAGGSIFPALLEELGCDVVKIHCKPDGIFPRGPEPTPDNITELCTVVRNTGADIGFACDPDADRLSVVDERGVPVTEEYSLVLSALSVLSQRSGPVAANVSTTSALDDIAESFGEKVYRSRVGEIHVVQMMEKHKCVIGGEGNGGIILPTVHYGRDALVGAALILSYLAGSDKPLSSVVADLPEKYMIKRKTTIDRDKLPAILERLHECGAGAGLDTTDGLKITFPRAWVHIRPSNTEPVVRIIAEAETHNEVETLIDRYMKKISAM